MTNNQNKNLTNLAKTARMRESANDDRKMVSTAHVFTRVSNNVSLVDGKKAVGYSATADALKKLK